MALRRRYPLLAILAAACLLGPAVAHAVESKLVTPRLTVAPGGPAHPRVALTFDACSGAADDRILATLVAHRIPATFFVTPRWMARNPAAMALLLDHADLFAIENHGARHVPAIDRPMQVYGLAAAGSPAAVLAEVEGGSRAIGDATGRRPIWFRGAAAVYTPESLALIQATGHKVAGFSVGADDGALLDAHGAAGRVAAARDGDVILAHANQPARPAGAGVVAGILALEARGFRFVRLDEAP